MTSAEFIWKDNEVPQKNQYIGDFMHGFIEEPDNPLCWPGDDEPDLAHMSVQEALCICPITHHQHNKYGYCLECEATIARKETTTYPYSSRDIYHHPEHHGAYGMLVAMMQLYKAQMDAATALFEEGKKQEVAQTKASRGRKQRQREPRRPANWQPTRAQTRRTQMRYGRVDWK